MKPLKIAVVVGVFPSVSETFIVNQLAYLKQQGHSLEILCLGRLNKDDRSHKTINEFDLIQDALAFNWRDLMPFNKFSRLIMALQILLKSIPKGLFWDFIRSLNPVEHGWKVFSLNPFYKIYYTCFIAFQHYDLVHIHFGDYAVRLSKQLAHFNKKVIITFHGYDAHHYQSDFYDPLWQNKANIFTVNTEFLKNKIIKLGAPEHKIHVIPAALNCDQFSPKRVTHDGFEILFVGRLIPLKAALKAIQIVHQLIKENDYVRLHVVGDGEEYQACRDYIELHDLNKEIILYGNRSQFEIIDLMNRSDVFLFPGIIDEKGRCEAQGLVLQEAQAMTLPVVISDVGGMHEGVKDGKTGFVVKNGQIKGFIDTLKLLLENPEKARVMGNSGREFILKSYDIRILGEKLLTIYRA